MINFNLLKTLNILYIQSNENIKKDFLLMINGLLNNVICANTAKEGIALFIENQNSIDLVISDIDMPDDNGIEILKGIKKEDFSIPIILITDNSQDDLLLEAIKYKVRDYLPTSVRKDELISSIQKAYKIRYIEKFKVEMESNFEELIRVINDVALVSKTDIDGKITFVNKYFCNTTEYSEDEIIGQKHDLTEELYDNMKLGRIWEGKKRSITKSNKIFFEYLNVIPIFNSLNNSIKEYMWISFVSTEEEIEQSEFKKKVEQNINSSRRINIEAREEIDRLFKELEKRKNSDFSRYAVTQEKTKKIRLLKEIASYRNKISLRQKQILEFKSNSEKNDYRNDEFNNSLKFKNQDIDYLTDELDNQIMILEELQKKKKIEENKLSL